MANRSAAAKKAAQTRKHRAAGKESGKNSETEGRG